MQKYCPKVSIIILNWNGLKDTIECLDSLKKITYSNYEIVVVDNASGKDEADLLQKKYGGYIRTIKTKKNLGFAGGNNVGIRRVLKEGKSKYVLLLNNDTVVEPNFLDELVKVGEQNDKIGMIGGKIYYYYQRDRLWYGGGRINLLALRAPHDTKEFSDVRNTNFITGCLMLIKTKVFEKIGLLSEDYFLTVEDWDFSYRVGKKFNMKITPYAAIYHKVSTATGGEKSPFNTYYCHRNKWIFLNKFVNNRINKVIAMLIYLLRFLLAKLLSIFRINIKNNNAIISATIDGIKGEMGKAGNMKIDTDNH